MLSCTGGCCQAISGTALCYPGRWHLCGPSLLPRGEPAAAGQPMPLSTPRDGGLQGTDVQNTTLFFPFSCPANIFHLRGSSLSESASIPMVLKCPKIYCEPQVFTNAFYFKIRQVIFFSPNSNFQLIKLLIAGYLTQTKSKTNLRYFI